MQEGLTENFRLKALALLLAALLWLSVTAAKEGEVTVSVPVRIRNLAPLLALATKAPSSIELRIAGPKIRLLHLSKERLAADLDLQGVGEGGVAFADLARTVALPGGLRVTRVYPATIELKLVKDEK
jgi:YbbR domain-containing protein